MANLLTAAPDGGVVGPSTRPFFADRLPKWLHNFPVTSVGLVVIIRLIAFWKIDLTDAHVVGYLPNDVTGLATLMHIFTGPDGLMLGLLFGFSAGLTLRANHLLEYRWAAFILGFDFGLGNQSRWFPPQLLQRLFPRNPLSWTGNHSLTQSSASYCRV